MPNPESGNYIEDVNKAQVAAVAEDAAREHAVESFEKSQRRYVGFEKRRSEEEIAQNVEGYKKENVDNYPGWTSPADRGNKAGEDAVKKLQTDEEYSI